MHGTALLLPEATGKLLLSLLNVARAPSLSVFDPAFSVVPKTKQPDISAGLLVEDEKD